MRGVEHGSSDARHTRNEAWFCSAAKFRQARRCIHGPMEAVKSRPSITLSACRADRTADGQSGDCDVAPY